MIKLIEQVQKSVDSLQTTVKEHIADQPAQRKAMITEMLNEAFPNGDHQAHRRYHENLIKKAEDQAQFWKKMRDELAKWGLIGFAGWALYTFGQFAAQAFLAWIQRGGH